MWGGRLKNVVIPIPMISFAILDCFRLAVT